MKKASLLCALVAIIATFHIQPVQAQDYPNMPQSVKEYIHKHFKGYNISHYEKERDIINYEHKVYVSNNRATFKMDFDKNGKVKSIESTDDNASLPKSVLPVKITQHVNSKFPNTRIIEWKICKSSQVVELSNDRELVYDSKGNFMHIDD